MTDTATLFYPTRCALGEGPLWVENRLFFFDILAKMLHAVTADGQNLQSWQMGEHASAAGKLKNGDLLIASETSLSRFDPATGQRRPLLPLEADNPATRSNDGRADRQGGFWIGTMGKKTEEGAGALYRFYEGDLHKLLEGITIPNAICFSPDGSIAYFADSAEGIVYQWPLDLEGFPTGTPAALYTHRDAGAPDGAVVDADSTLWCAIWEDHKILAIRPDGTPATEIKIPASRPTCPAFSSDGRIFTTSARQGMTDAELAAEPEAGSLFSAPFPGKILPEPEVDLE